MLPQQLAAASARHEQVVVAGPAGQRREHAAAGGVQQAHQPAFGAQTEPVRGVLDVARLQQAAVGRERRDADLQLRVGRVRPCGGLDGEAAQVVPVDGPAHDC